MVSLGTPRESGTPDGTKGTAYSRSLCSRQVLPYELIDRVHNRVGVVVSPRLELDLAGLERPDGGAEVGHVGHVEHEALARKRLVDGDLMVVNVLSVPREPRHGDDLLACVERAHD